jgi:predicted metal-dependent TIM-barrel fold hydrolase
MIIEPHIHMISRTTQDYEAMYNSGIRVCVEPSFWTGVNKKYAGSFFDYFSLSLDFETIRAERFGIDHWSAISMNPKESEDISLAREVISGIEPFLQHERCICVGEIGFNNNTKNEEESMRLQIELALKHSLPIMVHTPHVDKVKGTLRTIEILKEMNIPKEMALIDHNTEETIRASKESGYFCGFTVYPISKLTPVRVSNIIKEYGSDKMMVNGSADWGVSNPLALIDTVKQMKLDGHSELDIENLTKNNALNFYGYTNKFKPNFELNPIPIESFQR